jgi:signal transduction histidine kinase
MPEKQTQKYFEDQMDDEEVLYVFRKHPIVMRKGIIFWAVAMLVGPLYTVFLTFIYANNPEKYPTPNFFLLSLVASVILSVVVFFPSWIAWHYSVFIVTDQRFIQITQKGLFHRSVVDVGLNQIQMVNYEVAGLQETLLGFGTIMMQTYMGELLIHDVHHPAHIQKKMLKILRDKGIIATGAAGSYSPTDTSKETEVNG